MTLPEFSVRQTVLVNVLFFVCMIGGWNGWVRYHRDDASSTRTPRGTENGSSARLGVRAPV